MIEGCLFSILDLVQFFTSCKNLFNYQTIKLHNCYYVTPGGFEAAMRSKKEGCNVIISKKYTIAEWLQFANSNLDLLPRIVVSSTDFEYLNAVLRSVKEIKMIHLPFGQVYSQDFEDFIKKIRRNFPTHAIILGKDYYICSE